MIKEKVFQALAGAKRGFIDKLTPGAMKDYDGKAFSRNRSLTLSRLLMCILRCSPFCLQERLDTFYEDIGAEEEVVSKQAFSKARTNLDPGGRL